MRKMFAMLVLLCAVNVHAAPTISPGAPVQIGSDWYLPIEISGVSGDSLHGVGLNSDANSYVIPPDYNVEMTGTLRPEFTDCLCGTWIAGN